MTSEQNLYRFKVVLLGESAVGKSSLVTRLIKNQFNSSIESTLGATYSNHLIDLGKYQVQLQIWDTAGQERYHSLTPMYYRGSKGAFVVYDVTDYESFKRAQDWISELESENDTDVKIALVGNKIDIQNEVVSKEEASNYAKKKGYSFYQTSAKTGEGVTEMFHGLTKSLPLEQADLDLTETDYSDSDEIRIENSNPQKNANSGCC